MLPNVPWAVKLHIVAARAPERASISPAHPIALIAETVVEMPNEIATSIAIDG